jgi:hypothetical protein
MFIDCLATSKYTTQKMNAGEIDINRWQRNTLGRKSVCGLNSFNGLIDAGNEGLTLTEAL